MIWKNVKKEQQEIIDNNLCSYYLILTLFYYNIHNDIFVLYSLSFYFLLLSALVVRHHLVYALRCMSNEMYINGRWFLTRFH